jgi:hypothetical protein
MRDGSVEITSVGKNTGRGGKNIKGMKRIKERKKGGKG